MAEGDLRIEKLKNIDQEEKSKLFNEECMFSSILKGQMIHISRVWVSRYLKIRRVHLQNLFLTNYRIADRETIRKEI